MNKKLQITLLGMAAFFCLPMSAQQVTLKGIALNNRYDDGDQMKSEYLGYVNGKAVFLVDNGIYKMTWDGSSLSEPERVQTVTKQEALNDPEKAKLATNFNLMYGNSGSVYVDGKLATIMSRDESSTEDDELFNLRWWDANTGELLYSKTGSKALNVENAGLSYNPIDGQVYGLFYLTEAQLPDEITSDEDFFVSEDDALYPEAAGTDAGYCLGTIDLKTMTVTPITPGLYYDNFVAFAINSEGRAFALTSGGSSGYIDDNGIQRNKNGDRAGAQLFEFDLKTGVVKGTPVVKEDENGELYTTTIPSIPSATGFSSQYRKQSACFAKSNPNIMYWNGYYNSGKGINDYGSWGPLSDKEWRTNGKYDTCIYAVDITTGEAERLAKIPNRWVFSAIWADGDDCSDGSGLDIVPDEAPTAISNVKAAKTTATEIYNVSGQRINSLQKGINIVKTANGVQKVLNN